MKRENEKEMDRILIMSRVIGNFNHSLSICKLSLKYFHVENISPSLLSPSLRSLKFTRRLINHHCFAILINHVIDIKLEICG